MPRAAIAAVPAPATADLSEGSASLQGATRHLIAVPSLEGPPPDPPEPDPRFVAALAVHAFEALDGVRPVAQLASAITHELAERLGRIRALRTEKRHMFRERRRRTPTAGRPLICRPCATFAEATVVLHTAARSHAVAIRLEWVHGRWRASDLVVL